MDAKTLVTCMNFLPPDQAILIRGDHGVGKSQLVHQLAKNQNKVLIDVRASTMQEGDVVGYPDLETIKQTGVSSFALPSWYVRACTEACILFLDELNRGLIGVQNGMFQVVLDRELGNGPDGKPKRLHPETQVVAAINVGGDYTVTEMDPALLDRFWAADFVPTVEDWITWAGENGVNDVIIDFIRNHPEHLRPTKTIEAGKIAPTQRSWERLDKSLKHSSINLTECGGNAPSILYPISMGFIGVEAAAALKSFVDNYAQVITAENILNDWKKFEKIVKELKTEKVLAIIEKVKNHCKTNTWDLTQCANLSKFFDCMTGECKMSIYNGVLASGNTKNLTGFHHLVKEEIMCTISKAQQVSQNKK